MKPSESGLLSKLPGPEKKTVWLCILILIKFSLLIFLICLDRPTSIENSFAACSGDCESYLTPVDNLVITGNYSPDFRMPGYGAVYYLFRILFEKNIAANLVVIFQTIFDAVAALVLALTLLTITKRKSAFYLTLFFYGVGVTVSCYDNFILTESLTASVLIFGFHFLVRHVYTKEIRFAIISGLFFTWAYFLRPVNFPVLLIPVAVVFFSSGNSRIKHLLYFLLPVFIIQSAWTIRNFTLKNKLFVLTENTYTSLYTPQMVQMWDFCMTFSDFRKTTTFFDTTGMTYFGQAMQHLKQEDVTIPADIYTPDFNLDSLLKIRSLIGEQNSPATDSLQKARLTSIIIEKFSLYEKSVKKHHPFIVYARTPLKLTKEFIVQSGVHNLFFLPFSHLSFAGKIFKLFFVFIYVACFLLFLAGVIVFAKDVFNNKIILASFAIAFYLIFIHSIFLRSIELRYIVPAYPFFTAGAVFFLATLMDRRAKKI